MATVVAIMGTVTLLSIGVISSGFDAVGSVVPVTPYGRVDYQSLGWQSEDVTTSSTKFEPVSGLANIEVCEPILAATATVSMTLSGGPAEVRVLLANAKGKALGKLEPGTTTFDPGSAPAQSFSYVFVQPAFRWPRRAFFSAQWRSPDGREITMKSGSMQILYDRHQGDTC